MPPDKPIFAYPEAFTLTGGGASATEVEKPASQPMRFSQPHHPQTYTVPLVHPKPTTNPPTWDSPARSTTPFSLVSTA
jgi:hypothetical protein